MRNFSLLYSLQAMIDFFYNAQSEVTLDYEGLDFKNNLPNCRTTHSHLRLDTRYTIRIVPQIEIVMSVLHYETYIKQAKLLSQFK